MSDKINENSDEFEEELENYITLTDDNGEDVSFEFLDAFEFKGRNYAVMLPFEDEDGEVIILEVLPSVNPEEDEYISVDDEELLNDVFEEFKKRNSDEFDFS